MFYAILAYHEEAAVESWSRDEDAALMDDLLKVNDRLTREGRLGAGCSAWRDETCGNLARPRGRHNHRRPFCRDQGTAARFLCRGLRHTGGRRGGGARSASRQSDRRL